MSVLDGTNIGEGMKMSDTFDSTFDLFFDDTPRYECNECGSTENLIPLGSATAGAQLWICPACEEKRQAALQERIARQAQLVAEWAARDEWEES